MILLAFCCFLAIVCFGIVAIGNLAGAVIVFLKWLRQKKLALLLLSLGAFFLALVLAGGVIVFVACMHGILSYVFMW